jgi:hypothetical protein
VTRAIFQAKLQAAALTLEAIRDLQIDALALIRQQRFVFKRFPRSEPPASECERWEWLAFWLYSSLCEGHGAATICLNEIGHETEGYPKT